MQNTRKPGSRAQRDSKPLDSLPAREQTDSLVSPPEKPREAGSLSGKALTTELQANLPTDDPAVIKRFQAERERWMKLDEFFQAYPGDKKGFEEPFGKSGQALDHKRPYDISLVGATGVGKSALTNLLLDRPLSRSQTGEPVTETLLRFRHRVSSGKPEEAVVSYRDPDNLFSLIQREFGRFGLTPLKSASDVKAGLADALKAFQLPEDAKEEEKEEFSRTQEAVVDIVQLYFDQVETLERSGFKNTFPVSSENQVNSLDKHLPKFSGVIKEVNYYLQPNSGNTSLELPTNVCLVDLPGEFGKGAHEFIVEDSLPNAGAVVFLTRSPRTGTPGETRLARRVNEGLNIYGGSGSSEKAFLVLNTDKGQSEADLTNLLAGLKGTSEILRPRNTQPLQVCLKQGEEEGISELVEELNSFIREILLEQRITDGQSGVNLIVRELKSRHENRLDGLPLPENDAARIERAVTMITNRTSLAIPEVLGKFRESLLAKEETLKTSLKDAGELICEEIDSLILKTAEEAWEHRQPAQDHLSGKPVGKVNSIDVQTNVGSEVWKQLPEALEPFAQIFAEEYTSEFSKAGVFNDASVRSQLIEYFASAAASEHNSEILRKFFTEKDFFPEEDIEGTKGTRTILESMRTALKNFGQVGAAFAAKDEYSLLAPKGTSSDEASSDPGFDEPGFDEEAEDPLDRFDERLRHQTSASSEDSGTPGGSDPSQDRPSAADLMAALPREDTPKTEANFDAFGILARKRYQDAVLEDTVEAFFNVFKYQLLLAEDDLKTLLGVSMDKIRQESRTNSELRDAILGDNSPEKQKEIAELGAKIQKLEKI